MSIESIYPSIMPFVNSYINFMDIVEFYRDEMYKKEERICLQLKVEREGAIDLLEKMKYQDFIRYVLAHIQLEPVVAPIFFCEEDKSFFDSLNKKIMNERSSVRLTLNNNFNRYEVEGSSFMIQVLYAPLSQMHFYFVETAFQFAKYKKIESESVSFFANGQAPSLLENFIEEWCFERIGFSKKKLNEVMVCGINDFK